MRAGLAAEGAAGLVTVAAVTVAGEATAEEEVVGATGKALMRSSNLHICDPRRREACGG